MTGGGHRLDTEDVEGAAQIVGERRQAELGAHIGEAAHQEGALMHPLLDAAEGMLNGRRGLADFRGLRSIRARKIAQGRPQRGGFDRDVEFSHGLQELRTRQQPPIRFHPLPKEPLFWDAAVALGH